MQVTSFQLVVLWMEEFQNKEARGVQVNAAELLITVHGDWHFVYAGMYVIHEF